MKLPTFLKLFLLVLPLYFLISTFFVSPVLADYNSSLSTYKAQYSNYREAYSKYSVAKSTFLTYKTLTAQNAAVVAFKDVLNARNALMSSYFDVLQDKLNITPAIDPIDLQSFTGSKKSTKDWLAANQSKVRAAGTIEDLNSASEEFSQRYPQIQLDIKQSIGRILIAKGTNLDRGLASVFTETTQVTAYLRSKGEDTLALERGLIQAKVKRDLFAQKQQEERDFFFPKSSRDTAELLKGQQLAIEANQYLKESVSYLLELINPITGS